MNQKRFIKVASALGITALAAVACNKEYFEISRIEAESINPTFAIPLADMDITIEQLVARYGSLADKIYDPNYSSGTDSVFFLQVEYSDTVATLDGPPADIPAGFSLPPIALPLDSIEMNLFGQLGGADALFRLTNPSIKFSFYNSIDKAFNLRFDTLYTRNIATNQVYPFKVKESAYPFTINKPETANPTMYSEFVLNNDNTESYNGLSSPMSNVIEPTPKFIYNSGTLNPIGTEATKAGGNVKVVGTVLLPLEGYAKLNYIDTIPLSQIDTSSANLVEEVVLRMIFTNGLPLQAEVLASVYDTITWTKTHEFKFYDKDGNEKPNGQFLEAADIQGADKDYRPAAPKVFYSDLKLTQEEFKQVAKGNALVISAKLFSTDFDHSSPNNTNSATVKIYTDFGLRVQLGIKTRLNIGSNSINN